MDQISLPALIAARVAAKRDEDAAVERRRELDAAIVARIAADKAEGSVTHKTDGYKVTVTIGVTRKVADPAKLQQNWGGFVPELQAAFRWKPEVSVSELKKLPPALANLAADYIVSTPASPSIKIEAA